MPKKISTPPFKPTPVNTQSIVCRLYTVVFRQVKGSSIGDVISLGSESPFMLPLLNQYTEITHDGTTVKGIVSRIDLINSTFTVDLGFGTRETYIINVT